jgi:thiol-disulfide isomerase/thioredoxin
MKIIEFNNPDDDFESNTSEIRECLKGHTIVLIFASWCPHCVVMKPEWKQLKTELNDKVNIVEIESTNLNKIQQEDKVLFKKLFPRNNRVMFPTIKLYKDNRSHVYDNERTFDVMKKKFLTHFTKQTNTKKNTNSKDKIKTKSATKKDTKDTKDGKDGKTKKSTKKTQPKKGGTPHLKFKKDLDTFIKKMIN